MFDIWYHEFWLNIILFPHSKQLIDMSKLGGLSIFISQITIYSLFYSWSTVRPCQWTPLSRIFQFRGQKQRIWGTLQITLIEITGKKAMEPPFSTSLLSSLELCLSWIVFYNLSPCGPWAWSFGRRCGSHCEVWRIMTVACFRLSPNSSWINFRSIYISIWVQKKFKRY